MSNNTNTNEQQTDLHSGSCIKKFSIKEYIKSKIKSIKNFVVMNFTIYSEIEPMLRKIEIVEKYMIEVKKELEDEIELLQRDIEMYKSILNIITTELPDMFWLKLQDGRYAIANKTIKDKLLLDDNPIGKTDVELATAAKLAYGDENHTFGEKCGNSDLIVANTLENQRFLESGKVKGKMLYLEVYKAPLIINGEFIGVFGSGRDMTEYIEAYIEQRILMEKYAPGITTKLDNIFKKYSFQSDDIA